MNIQNLLIKAPITLLLIVIFVGFALYQLTQGVSMDNPSTNDLLRFGANFLPLSLTHEPWRVISSVFLHIGIIHLLFNGFAVYYFGQITEQIIGKWQFLMLFLLSALGGNLLNLFITWQDVQAGGSVGLSAGASGGIMGLGAFLLALAVLRAPTMFVLNTKSLFFVMAINLLMGFALPGIDNAAHIGGALIGALFGMMVSLVLKSKLSRAWFWKMSVIVAAVFGVVWWQLHTQVLALIA